MSGSTTRVLATAVAAAVLLGACGGEDGAQSSASGGATTPAATDEKRVAVGETVVVEHFAPAARFDDEPEGEVAVTVLAARKGTAKQLTDSGLRLDPDEKAATPYYVDVRYENRTGKRIPKVRGILGEDGAGRIIGALTIISLGGPDFRRCKQETKDAVAAGKALEKCTILLVPAGAQLTGVTMAPGGMQGGVTWTVE